jgi:hypothetical protein
MRPSVEAVIERSWPGQVHHPHALGAEQITPKVSISGWLVAFPSAIGDATGATCKRRQRAVA